MQKPDYVWRTPKRELPLVRHCTNVVYAVLCRGTFEDRLGVRDETREQYRR